MAPGVDLGWSGKRDRASARRMIAPRCPYPSQKFLVSWSSSLEISPLPIRHWAIAQSITKLNTKAQLNFDHANFSNAIVLLQDGDAIFVFLGQADQVIHNGLPLFHFLLGIAGHDTVDQQCPDQKDQ